MFTEAPVCSITLCRTVTISKDVVTQFVIPLALVDVVLLVLHDTPSAGHPGRDRTLAAARSKYYWPTMRTDVEITSHSVFLVLKQKIRSLLHLVLEYSLPAVPFDVVGVDLIQLPRSRKGSVYILVCVDHFSRFVVLAPLRNKSAVICSYHRDLLRDSLTEFKNQILADICCQYNIKQTFITAHHPASNGLS